MKTQNKKKIIVSTLALAMGAALAGSISGSVAWYQYSTRAAAQIAGTAVGTIGELQVQGRKGNSGNFTASNGSNFLLLGTEKYKPMSYYLDGTTEQYVDAPVYQKAVLPEQKSDALRYVDYELQFKFDQTDSTGTSNLAKKVYLTYFDIEEVDDGTDDKDIASAVRVELLVGGAKKFLLQKVGEDNASTSPANELETKTNGNLDLNDNTKPDTNYWDCQDAVGTPIVYKNSADDGKGLSYVCNAHADAIVDANNTDPYDLELAHDDDDSTDNTPKALVETKTSGWSDSLTVRIWLEGWALLDNSASWAKEYINQNFKIDMQFACSAERQ